MRTDRSSGAGRTNTRHFGLMASAALACAVRTATRRFALVASTVFAGVFLAGGAFLAAGASAQQQAPHPIAATVNGTATCTVARIVDGDTFVCQGGSRIRLLLVDADEAGQGAWADSATHFLERVMPAGTRVRLEFDVALTDRYERLLAHVYARNVFVNRELARRGLAHVAVYPPNVKHLEAIRAAADSARSGKRGLWGGGSAFECSPADFRAGRCR